MHKHSKNGAILWLISFSWSRIYKTDFEKGHTPLPDWSNAAQSEDLELVEPWRQNSNALWRYFLSSTVVLFFFCCRHNLNENIPGITYFQSAQYFCVCLALKEVLFLRSHPLSPESTSPVFFPQPEVKFDSFDRLKRIRLVFRFDQTHNKYLSPFWNMQVSK